MMKRWIFSWLVPQKQTACQGKISNESPVGKALIGAKQGDVVDVELADGEVMQYKVLKIERNI